MEKAKWSFHFLCLLEFYSRKVTIGNSSELLHGSSSGIQHQSLELEVWVGLRGTKKAHLQTEEGKENFAQNEFSFSWQKNKAGKLKLPNVKDCFFS